MICLNVSCIQQIMNQSDTAQRLLIKIRQSLNKIIQGGFPSDFQSDAIQQQFNQFSPAPTDLIPKQSRAVESNRDPPLGATDKNPSGIAAQRSYQSFGLKLKKQQKQSQVELTATLRSGSLMLTKPVVKSVKLVMPCTPKPKMLEQNKRHQSKPAKPIKSQKSQKAPPKSVKTASVKSNQSKDIQIAEQEKDDDDICPICYDKMSNSPQFGEKPLMIRILTCKHIYHDQCIAHWLNNYKRVCPVCKQQTT